MESMDKERRRAVLERKYGEEERRRSIDSRRKPCPRGILSGGLDVVPPAFATFGLLGFEMH